MVNHNKSSSNNDDNEGNGNWSKPTDTTLKCSLALSINCLAASLPASMSDRHNLLAFRPVFRLADDGNVSDSLVMQSVGERGGEPTDG